MVSFGSRIQDDFFLEKQVNEGLSLKALDCYRAIFSLLRERSDLVSVSNLTTFTPENFRRLLAETFLARSWSSATYNYYWRYLNVFCGWLVRSGHLSKNPFVLIQKRKQPQRLPRSLSTDQVAELLLVSRTLDSSSSFCSVRNATMVMMFLYTGLRLSELLNLTVSDVDLEHGMLSVRMGKGAKDRSVPIPSLLCARLLVYFRERADISARSVQVFLSRNGNPLTAHDMRFWLNRLRSRLSFTFTWHQLRHTYATELVRNNFDVYNVSRILGHSRIETTKIYLSSDTSRLKSQIDAVDLFT